MYNAMKDEVYQAPILVVGVGNILMKDEGVGVRVIEELMKRDIPDWVELLDGGTAGFDLLPYMLGRKKIIIVDVIKTDDAPGSIYRCAPDDLCEKSRGFSLHDVGILEVIRALRMRGENPGIEIVGIVPEDIESLEMSLSDAVFRAVPKAASVVLDIIHEPLPAVANCPSFDVCENAQHQ